LEVLSLSEPAKQLDIQLRRRMDGNVVREPPCPQPLDALQALGLKLVVSQEANPKMVPPYSHAGKMVPAHEIDA
jgi:hypothetical protein